MKHTRDSSSVTRCCSTSSARVRYVCDTEHNGRHLTLGKVGRGAYPRHPTQQALECARLNAGAHSSRRSA
jgi:hypothetical protein